MMDGETVEEMVAESHPDDDRRALLSLMQQATEKRLQLEDKDRWMRVVMDEHTRSTRPFIEAVAYLEEQIKVVAERLMIPGTKHVDVPGYGRVQFTDHKTSVTIADKDAFLEWAREAERTDLIEPVPATEKLRTNDAKKAAAEALLKEGVTLPGVEVKPEHREASVQWEGLI